MKKAIAIIILSLLLNSCESGGHSKYYKDYMKESAGYKYHVLVVSPSTNKTLAGASHESYASAFKRTIEGCETHGLYDCVPHTRGNTVVYNTPSREDVMITKAQNLCRKIGVSPGTTQFTDCTIKLLSTTSSQQQTIIVGQRRRSIYPLHCRQMGGASNC